MSEAEAPPFASRFFQIAVQTGVESAVRLHIDRGDEVNARNEKGRTLLMIAASRNKASICKLLLQANADITTKVVFAKYLLSFLFQKAPCICLQ